MHPQHAIREWRLQETERQEKREELQHHMVPSYIVAHDLVTAVHDTMVLILALHDTGELMLRLKDGAPLQRMSD